MNGNNLRVFPPELTCLRALKELRAEGNPIRILPVKLGLLPLEKLSFDAENIDSPPAEVARKGVEWTLHYMRRVHGAEARKVLVLEGGCYKGLSCTPARSTLTLSRRYRTGKLPIRGDGCTGPHAPVSCPKQLIQCDRRGEFGELSTFEQQKLTEAITELTPSITEG